MVFNSVEFVIFLPIVLALYLFLPKKAKNPFLLAASYVFYAAARPPLALLLLFCSALSYLCGRMICRARSKRAGKVWLSVGIFGCFGALVYFKYFGFLLGAAEQIYKLFSGGQGFSFALDILLPAGISFYTFQTVSYLVDVYKGKLEAEKNFIDYALFVSFFPQLVAGPIERPENLLPQLKAHKKPTADDFAEGLDLMLCGAFKKICVADVCGIYVSRVFGAAKTADGLSALFAALLFCAQIYCDFSGYSDIAVGCARLFGIRLTENFDAPYSSASIGEFWNRWHISLSRWLRDYVYIPLGGNRCSTARNMLNILVVFLVSGLWHGAAYTFIIWGLFHGACLIVERLSKPLRDKVWRGSHEKLRRVCGRALTFCAVCLSFVIFRADSLSDAFALIGAIFGNLRLSARGFADFVSLTGISALGAAALCALFVGLWCLRFIRRAKAADSAKTSSGARFARFVGQYLYRLVLIWCVIGCFIYTYNSGSASNFIYFQF